LTTWADLPRGGASGTGKGGRAVTEDCRDLPAEADVIAIPLCLPATERQRLICHQYRPRAGPGITARMEPSSNRSRGSPPARSGLARHFKPFAEVDVLRGRTKISFPARSLRKVSRQNTSKSADRDGGKRLEPGRDVFDGASRANRAPGWPGRFQVDVHGRRLGDMRKPQRRFASTAFG